jgi:hypothetical protein
MHAHRLTPLRRAVTIGVWLSVLLPAAASAQSRPMPCAGAVQRQFDFWVGQWEVFNPAGKKVGENSIEPIHGGCALRETWRGQGGVEGTSLNSVDMRSARWVQHWVDNQGGRLFLVGGLQGAQMVLSSVEHSDFRGALPGQDRVTWTPLEGGAVRQLWERSLDGGQTWSVSFDGKYVRKP